MRRCGQAGKFWKQLGEIAPVVAVRGNVDTERWARALPETAVAEAGRGLDLCPARRERSGFNPEAAGFQIVVSGHSTNRKSWSRWRAVHQSGKRRSPRFQLPVTVARLRLGRTAYEVEFVDLEVRIPVVSLFAVFIWEKRRPKPCHRRQE